MTRPNAHTLGELFLKSHPPALLAVEEVSFVEWSGNEWQARTKAVAWEMHWLGIQPGERVGLWLPNSRAMLLADLALSLLGAVPVPLHADLPEHLAAKMLHQVGAVAVVADRPLDGGWRWQLTSAEIQGLEPDYHPWRTIEAGPDDAAVILFTSGTTGEPRGVILSHRQLLTNATSTQQVLPFAEDGVVVNFLPFSHIYARNSDLLQSLIAGVTLALAESAKTLNRDLPRLRPTNMHGVPYFYEKALAQLGEGGLTTLFGNRVDWLKAGGAALQPEVAMVYHRAGLPLLQGYGMTEAAPVIATCRRDSYKPGTVGKPLPDIDWRIEPSGELTIRGANIMIGYWNEPARNAGEWLATGDLIEIDGQGLWRIVGRCDHRLTLATGRKFSPEPIEEAILQDSAVLEVVIVGEGRSHAVALIHPRPEMQLSSDDWLKRWLPQLNAFPPWERPGSVGTLPGPLTSETNERTITGKLRRAEVLARHAPLIERLYRG